MELLNTATTDQILHWRDVLEEYAAEFGDLHVFSDTETTGSSIVDSETELYHRVLEWSLSFCYRNSDGLFCPIKDQNGNRIRLCEAINPWIEAIVTQRQAKTTESIPADAVRVHGITQEYLFGQSPGVHRPKLPKPAPAFNVVFDAVEMLLSFKRYESAEIIAYIYFYNAAFDSSFINSEMEMFSKPPMESFFVPIDPMKWIKKVLPEYGIKGYSLDVAYEWAQKYYPEVCTSTIDRSVHSASVDTEMLERVTNAYFLHLKKKSEKS